MTELAQAVQQATQQNVELAYVDAGYTGERARQDAQAQGIHLEVVKLPQVRKGFVLLPRRWVVERSFGWVARFRRLARDYERLPQTLAGLHFLAFAILLQVTGKAGMRCAHPLGVVQLAGQVQDTHQGFLLRPSGVQAVYESFLVRGILDVRRLLSR